MAIKPAVISNQVFIGCPWKIIRPKYIKIITKLEKRFPLSFVLLGREVDHSAEELLKIIKQNLLSSSAAIFDVTGGNANVSLEYGIADTSGIRSALYLNVHGKHKRTEHDSAIISDLAGQRRKQYKNEASLERLLVEFAENHSFSKLFEKAFRRATKSFNRGNKKRARGLALKIFHELDRQEKVRRDDLVQNLRADINDYGESEIEHLLRRFHHDDLLIVSRGRYSEIKMA